MGSLAGAPGSLEESMDTIWRWVLCGNRGVCSMCTLFHQSPSKVLSKTLPERILLSFCGRFWTTLGPLGIPWRIYCLKVRFKCIFEGFWCRQGVPEPSLLQGRRPQCGHGNIAFWCQKGDIPVCLLTFCIYSCAVAQQ